MPSLVRTEKKRLKILLMNDRKKTKESLWHVSVRPHAGQARVLSLNLYLENSFLATFNF